MATLANQIILCAASLLWFFSFCTFGDNVTNRYEDVTESLYDCSYALLCLGMGKHLLVAMNNGQNPVKMKAMMNIECTRECFKKVNEFESLS